MAKQTRWTASSTSISIANKLCLLHFPVHYSIAHLLKCHLSLKIPLIILFTVKNLIPETGCFVKFGCR